jgi:hypothetical protein
MATTTELETRLEKLRAMRAAGTRIVEIGERRVEYRSDQELAAAIADLEHQLAGARGPRVHTIRVHASKGLGD